MNTIKSLSLFVLLVMATLCVAVDTDLVTCNVTGFKVNYTKITECCLSNTGGSDSYADHMVCRLDIRGEGSFRRCVSQLGYAVSIDCQK
ncbi:hypothetical protein BJ944DRAFT_251006 [Cunninghamella echinulata]|nr:hypothetical protein BJ944DRAFT_251006 [Cunninghamella echinulata]